jgi:hypothetical protein
LNVLPEDVKAQIGELLVGMCEGALMRGHLGQGLLERFVPVRDSGYDDIRAMLRPAEQAGLTVLRQPVPQGNPRPA